MSTLHRFNQGLLLQANNCVKYVFGMKHLILLQFSFAIHSIAFSGLILQ